MDYASWLDSGQWVTVLGRRVFYIDTGSNKPVLCLLHGYPTSCFDYVNALPFLSHHFRVIMHDHLGFGASDKPLDYSYSMIEQTDLAHALWQKLGITHAFIVAHDYGTSIATEIMARITQNLWPIQIHGFVLSNGSIHIELSKLRLIQKLLRLPVIGNLIAQYSTFSVFKRSLQRLFFDHKKIDLNHLEVQWHLMTSHQGRACLSRVSKYTLERRYFWHRWVGAIKNVNTPIDLIWARNDPVAVAQIAKVLHQETKCSSLKWIEECGHFPMLEKPEEWSEAIIQAVEIRRSN